MLGAVRSVLKGRTMSWGVKKTLYQQVIVPKVTYDAKTWGLREAERRRLNVFEMKCLRPMVGVTRWEMIRNEEIRRRAGIEGLMQKKLTEECYDGLATWNGWMRGAGQERSGQLKWIVDWGEEGLGLDG